MADKQIFRTGPVDVPFRYELEPSEAFAPLIIQATFDGSGAGEYLPAVVYVSREGHVIGRAVADSPVAAGDDAEVTWFPGVKPSPPAAVVAAGLPFASVELFDPVSPLVAGAYAPNIKQLRVNVPGAAIFSVDPLQPSFLQIAEVGVYGALLTYAMSNPITLPINGFIGAGLAGGSIVGSPPQPIEELASTTATRRVQDAAGVTFFHSGVPNNATRYVFRTNQTMFNVGPLGWCMWQMSPTVEA